MATVMVAMLLASAVLLPYDQDTDTAAGRTYNTGLQPITDDSHYITYHYSDSQSDAGKDVKVKYYGIAATEYNPELWAGTVKNVTQGSATNWIGPEETVSIDSVVYHVELEFTLSYNSETGKLYLNGEDVGNPRTSMTLFTANASGWSLVTNSMTKTYDFTGLRLEDRFYVNDPTVQNNRFKLTYNDGGVNFTAAEAILSSTEKLYAVNSDGVVTDNPVSETIGDVAYSYTPTTGTGHSLILGFDIILNSGTTVVNKVFAGWEDSSGNMVYPGDVVSNTVTDLYAKWDYPDLFKVKTAGIVGSAEDVDHNYVVNTSSVTGTTVYYNYGEINALSSNVSTLAGKSHSYDDSSGKYTTTLRDNMFRSIYHITANVSSQDVNMPAGTYRSANPGSPVEVTMSNSFKCGGDTVIDSVVLKYTADSSDRKAEKTYKIINAQFHRLIIGTGVTSLNAATSNYPKNLCKAPTVMGGTASTTTYLEQGKTIVSDLNSSLNGITVNIATFVIVHSGTYAHIVAGATQGHVIGSNAKPLSTYLVVKGATVMGVVAGSAGNCDVVGGTSANTEAQGGTFIYATGLDLTGDRYEDVASGHQHPTQWQLDESSMLHGSSYNGKVTGSTHIFVTGESSVFDVQGGGRNYTSGADNSYLEITGKSEVRHAAVGAITDGPEKKLSRSVVDHVHIRVAGTPKIAMLFGAGYDTWGISEISTMYNSGDSIDLKVQGGTIGYLYGGGMRGTIGTTTNPVTINIEMVGGTVEYDLFGGGRGGLDKTHHLATSDSPDGRMGRWENSENMHNNNTTGYSKVYGNITINLSGGLIKGSVYGGGESMPALAASKTSYLCNIKDKSGDRTPDAPTTGVAEVFGNVAVNLSGTITVNGSVYGAGKGIVIDGNGNVDVSESMVTVTHGGSSIPANLQKIPYYASMMIYCDGFKFIPWICNKDAYRVDANGNGIVVYASESKQLYEGYAKVNGTATVTVDAGMIGGSVYGGGAMGATAPQAALADGVPTTSVTINNATIGQDVFGAGLGASNKYSVTGLSIATINNGTISGSVYGGSAYGKVDSASVAISNGTIYGSVYGGGLGVMDIVSVTGDTRVDISGGSIAGSVYGGAAYGIVNGNLVTTITGGMVAGSVYGGGLGTPEHTSTGSGKKRTVYVKDSAAVTVSNNSVSQYTIGGSVYGGSSEGDDLSGATVIFASGSVGGSIFGGGFMGRTYGNVDVRIGLLDIDGTPLTNNLTTSTVYINDSVFAGGDVKITEGSTIEPYTFPLVYGDGSVSISGASGYDIYVSGSIMGSGNSCLTTGTTTLTIDHFNNPLKMTGIHRFTSATITSSILQISGKESIFGVWDSEHSTWTAKETKNCSISHVGSLTVMDSTTLYLEDPVEDLGAYSSKTVRGADTTSSSPLNKIVFTQGSILAIRTYNVVSLAYGNVSGYTIISVSDNAPYGGYILGSINSPGGFVMMRNGSYEIADKANVSNEAICWFLSGVENQVASVTLNYGGGAQVTQRSSVDIMKLQEGSTVRYTGGAFVASSDAQFVYPSTSMNDYSLALGFKDGTGRMLVAHDQHNAALGNTTGLNYFTYYLPGVSSYTEVDGVTRTISPVNLDTLNGDLAVVEDGVFALNVEFRGTPENVTTYLGCLVLYLQEVNQITYTLSDGTTKTDYMVANKIEVRIDLFVSGDTIEDEYSVAVNTVNGNGDGDMVIAPGLTNQTLLIKSMTPVPGLNNNLTIRGVMNVGNTTGWKEIKSIAPMNNFEGDLDHPEGLPVVGTLAGGFMATIRFSISNFDYSSYSELNPAQYVIEFVRMDSAGNYIMDGPNVAVMTLTITVTERDRVYVTFYDKDQGMGTDTEGKVLDFPYGTVLTESDCPAVLEHFLGWYMDPEYNNLFNFSTPLTGDISLHARYTYVVTFDYQNGTTSQMYVASSALGATIAAPTAPTRLGYNFIGWYTEPECTTLWSFSHDTVTGSLTLYAKWEGLPIRILFYQDETLLTYEYGQTVTIDGKVYHLDTPVVRYGGLFNVLDQPFSNDMKVDTFILDVAKNLLTGNQKFIRWQAEHSGAIIPIYEDTRIDEHLINIREDPDPTYGMRVIRLYAVTSPVAIRVTMSAGTNDLSATVAAPASGLVYPEQQIVEDGNLVFMVKKAYRVHLTYTSQIQDGFAFYDSGGNVIDIGTITNFVPTLTPDHGLYEAYMTVTVTDYANRASLHHLSNGQVSVDATATDEGEYVFTYRMNDATRSGWFLSSWHNQGLAPGVGDDPTAGMEVTSKLLCKVDSDGNVHVSKEYVKEDDGTWLLVIDHGSTVANMPRLDDDANVYTITYVAQWEQLTYVVTISNTAHGDVDAYYIQYIDGRTVETPGTTFSAHYGDRIRLVFTPYDGYQFHTWSYSGECLIEDPYSDSTTLVVTGDSVIYASDTGERIVRLYLKLDDNSMPLSAMYLRTSGDSTAEPIEIANKNTDEPGFLLYREYVDTGSYDVLLKDSTTYYRIGSVVIGSGDTVFRFAACSFDMQIKNDRIPSGDPTGDLADAGIISWPKYVGHQIGSGDRVFGTIEIAEGYIYKVKEGAPGTPFDNMRDIGADGYGTVADTEVIFEITEDDFDTNPYARVLAGYVKPISFTLTYILGNGVNEDFSAYAAPVSKTINYGDTFTLYDAAHIAKAAGSGTMADDGYNVYGWYLTYDNYSSPEMASEPLYRFKLSDTSRLDHDAIDFLRTHNLLVGNSSFTICSWILKNASVTMAVSFFGQNAMDDEYTHLEQTTTPLVYGDAERYTGLFRLPIPDGFYLEDDGGDYWIHNNNPYIIFVFKDGDGHTLSNVNVSRHRMNGEDVSIELDGEGKTSLASVDLTINFLRRTVPVYLDINMFDHEGLPSGWVHDSGTLYTKTCRYGEIINFPGIRLQDVTDYKYKGWYYSGDNPNYNYFAEEYTISLADCDKVDLRFTAVGWPPDQYTLTLITSTGTFKNGKQRYTVKLTPHQLLINYDDPEHSPLINPTCNDPAYEFAGYAFSTPEGWSYNLPDMLYGIGDLTLVAQWTVVDHTIWFMADSESPFKSKVTITATVDAYETELHSGSHQSHHSEILLTIRVDPGYLLDIPATLAKIEVPSGVDKSYLGSPVLQSEGIYLWRFFLDSDVTIKVVPKESLLTVTYVVNGKAWQTAEVHKYDTVALPSYDVVGYDMAPGDLADYWYTTAEMTVRYTPAPLTDSIMLYKTVVARTYFVWLHPNDGQGDAPQSDIENAIANYPEQGIPAELQGYLQAFQYGKAQKLITSPYTGRTADLFCGWSVYSGGTYTLTYLADSNVINLSSASKGLVELYGYYVMVNTEQVEYDGGNHGGTVSEKTGAASDLTVLYSSSHLSSEEFQSIFGTASQSSYETPLTFKDSGTHITYYCARVEGDGVTKYLFGSFSTRIDPREITITSGSATAIYSPTGGIWKTDTPTIVGLVAGEDSGLSFTFTYTSTNKYVGLETGSSVDNVFTVTFDNNRAKAFNYVVTLNYGTLTIVAQSADITISGLPDVITYGENGNSYTFTVNRTDLTYELSGEGVITVTLTPGSTTGTITVVSAGEVNLILKAADPQVDDYTVPISVGKKNIVITDQTLTVTGDVRKMYDGNDSLPAGIGFVIPDISAYIYGTDEVTVTVTGSSKYNNVNAGDRAIMVYFALSGAKANCYMVNNNEPLQIDSVTREAVTTNCGIDKRNITLTAASSDVVFDSTYYTAGYSLNEYTVSGDGFIKLDNIQQGIDTVTFSDPIRNAGFHANHIVSYTLKSGTMASNYNITTVDGTINMAMKVIPVPTLSNNNILYVGRNVSPTMNYSEEDAAYFSISGTTSAKECGTYTITFTLKFNSEQNKNVKWDVQDSEQIYTPKDATWNITLGQLLREWFQLDMEYDYFIYDGEDHDDVLVKVYEFLEESDYSISYSSTNGGDTHARNQGTITATVTGLGSYEGSVLNYTFYIHKKDINVVIGEDQTFVYNGTSISVVSQVIDVDPIVPSDVEAGVTLVAPEPHTTAGTYYAAYSLTGDTPGNYDIIINNSQAESVMWTITKADLYLIALSVTWFGDDSPGIVEDSVDSIAVFGIKGTDMELLVNGNKYISLRVSLGQNGVISISGDGSLPGGITNNYTVIKLSGTGINLAPHGEISVYTVQVQLGDGGSLGAFAPAPATDPMHITLPEGMEEYASRNEAALPVSLMPLRRL